MKRLVLAAVISSLLAAPAYGQGESPVITVGMKTETESNISLLNQFEKAKKRGKPGCFKITREIVNIKKEPDPDSEILGQSDINTRVEVAKEIDGWAMIVTEGGYAYMKSDSLTEEPPKPLPYTEEDLEILTRVLTGECQAYPDSEQLLVGSVVLNRVKNPNYPNTIKGVVFQKGQYACTRDGNYYRTPTERNRANAKWLLENGSILPENVVYQSGGRQGSGVYLKTLYHYFCYR